MRRCSSSWSAAAAKGSAPFDSRPLPCESDGCRAGLTGKRGGHLGMDLSRARRGDETPPNWCNRAVDSAPECSTAIVARNPVRRSLSEGEVEMRDRPKAAPACTHSGILRHHPSSTASSSPANRSGSAMASMATIFPCRIVKSSAIIRRPRGATTTPTAAVHQHRPRCPRAATHRQRRHASAPRTSCGPPPGTATASERRTTSGSRTASRP